jgi:regulator of protease activity HflC (stomatin/prohibitin superfamily)
LERGDWEMAAIGALVALLVLAIVLVIALLASAIKIINPYEAGIYLRLGRLIRVLNPGVNFVTPLVSTVIPVDMRTQSVAVTCRNVRFRDGQKAELVAFSDYKVRDPEKAYSSTANMKYALADMIEKTTRAVVGRAPLDDFDRHRELLNERLMEAVKKESTDFGIEAVSAEIREAGTAPLPLDVPFSRRYTTTKGIVFVDTTDHNAPRKVKIPQTTEGSRPVK